MKRTLQCWLLSDRKCTLYHFCRLRSGGRYGWLWLKDATAADKFCGWLRLMEFTAAYSGGLGDYFGPQNIDRQGEGYGLIVSSLATPLGRPEQLTPRRCGPGHGHEVEFYKNTS